MLHCPGSIYCSSVCRYACVASENDEICQRNAKICAREMPDEETIVMIVKTRSPVSRSTFGSLSRVQLRVARVSFLTKISPVESGVNASKIKQLSVVTNFIKISISQNSCFAIENQKFLFPSCFDVWSPLFTMLKKPLWFQLFRSTFKQLVFLSLKNLIFKRLCRNCRKDFKQKTVSVTLQLAKWFSRNAVPKLLLTYCVFRRVFWTD